MSTVLQPQKECEVSTCEEGSASGISFAIRGTASANASRECEEGRREDSAKFEAMSEMQGVEPQGTVQPQSGEPVADELLEGDRWGTERSLRDPDASRPRVKSGWSRSSSSSSPSSSENSPDSETDLSEPALFLLVKLGGIQRSLKKGALEDRCSSPASSVTDSWWCLAAGATTGGLKPTT